MKRLIILGLCLLIGGCTFLPVADVSEVLLVSIDGVINAPLINGAPFGYEVCVQAGDKLLLDFNPNRDQYGNRSGLSSSRYTIDEVTIKCELKTEFDTIFATSDSNAPIWFPCWTAPIELISGLPIPYSPLEGYPWDSCRTVGIDQMPAQTATITATARATWIEVEFVLPEQDGTYILDLPGQRPTGENTIKIKIDEAGLYTVTHSGGQVYEFTVPIDWFFIQSTWEIEIGPTGAC